MNKIPSISVIMPVYNSQVYLKKSIMSMINQTLKSVEIICINDCSTDDSLKILKKFQKKDERIKIINNNLNLGPGESRNAGIDVAKGEYICFLDSDDWLEKNACEILYNNAVKNNSDIVYIRPKFIFSNKIILDKRLISSEDASDGNIVFKKNLLRKVAWAPWSKLIKREMIINNRIKFPDIYIAEDMDFSYKSIYYAKKITCAEEYLYNYNLHEGSLMSFTNSKRRIDNYFESINLLKGFLKKEGIFKKYHNEFLYFKFYNYLAIYGVIYYSKEKLDFQYYKNKIRKDKDFRLFKLFKLGYFDSVIIGSFLIKLKLFNPIFKLRENLRILFGQWGKRRN